MENESGKWVSLPENALVRMDGRVEEICEHSVGHPVGHIYKWKDWMAVHGCDGCCKDYA